MHLCIEREELDLIAGGPPCQGFSINAPIRSTLDERNHLFKEYLRFVDAFAPRAVLIENVPGLVSFEHGATLHAILDALAELGYGADVRILGAPNYGVPQMRWRTIILGVRGRELPPGAYPDPIYHAPIHANFTSTVVEEYCTTVYKVQEAFSAVDLPEQNVYRDAIRRSLYD